MSEISKYRYIINIDINKIQKIIVNNTDFHNHIRHFHNPVINLISDKVNEQNFCL